MLRPLWTSASMSSSATCAAWSILRVWSCTRPSRRCSPNKASSTSISQVLALKCDMILTPRRLALQPESTRPRSCACGTAAAEASDVKPPSESPARITGAPSRRWTSSAMTATAASMVKGSSRRLPWPGRSGACTCRRGSRWRRTGSHIWPFSVAPWIRIRVGKGFSMVAGASDICGAPQPDKGDNLSYMYKLIDQNHGVFTIKLK